MYAQQHEQVFECLIN